MHDVDGLIEVFEAGGHAHRVHEKHGCPNRIKHLTVSLTEINGLLETEIEEISVSVFARHYKLNGVGWGVEIRNFPFVISLEVASFVCEAQSTCVILKLFT